MTTFTVYRKEKDDVNPPVAIATDLTAKSYVDSTVVKGKTYLYSVAAVKNSVEKISNDIEVHTYPVDPLDSYVVSLLRFENDLTDEKGNIWTARNSGTYVADGELQVNTTNGGLLCTDTEFLNFGTADFCFEAIVDINAASLSPHFLRNNFPNWATYAAILNLENQKMRYVFYGPPVIVSTQSVPAGVHHLVWSRDASGMMRMFLNGELLRADSYPYAVNFSYWGSTLFEEGLIKSRGVRITKGHARYTASFTPPTQF